MYEHGVIYQKTAILMSVEPWWNDTDSGKTDVLGGNSVPVLLFLAQISNELTWHRTLAATVTDRWVAASTMS